VLTDKQKARYLETARVAGLWFVNNQNAPGQAWGGVEDSADNGRVLYEYFPATGYCRGAGVWSQALATTGLLALSQVDHYEGEVFDTAWKLAADYLVSLQFMDKRRSRSYGSFRERTPQTRWGSCRDGATGCFALATLARHLDDPELKERADLYCKWYATQGSGPDTWPYRFFDHDKGEASGCEIEGDWQAGGALAYFYTACATGNDKWIRRGLRPVAGKLLDLGRPVNVDGNGEKWHGESRIVVGNDDFATVAAIAAFRSTGEKKYLDFVRERVRWILSYQDEDGSFPNGAGTFVVGLTLLDYMELVLDEKLDDDIEAPLQAALRAAEFALSLQETSGRDMRAYGGFYGQSNYGVSRDRIHNRSTHYAIHMYLRLSGYQAPCLSAVNW
jgi:hypothetical protein